MSGEPPCNLRDSWVIPRIQAWVVVIGLALSLGTIVVAAYHVGGYMTRQESAMEAMDKRIGHMEGQILWLYCRTPGKATDPDCSPVPSDGHGK